MSLSTRDFCWYSYYNIICTRTLYIIRYGSLTFNLYFPNTDETDGTDEINKRKP